MTIRPNPDAKLWLFDFDNTLAALEREVDWPGSRRELEAYLRAEGVNEQIFVEIPKGNLPLYSALHSRWLRAPHSGKPAATRDDTSEPRAAAETLLRRSSAISERHELIDAETVLAHCSKIIERHELIGAERALPTPGAIDLLNTVAARGAVAIIVTSNSSRTVARWLEIHRASHLIRDIVGRDTLLALKPSPEMVARAFELAAIPRAGTFSVTDFAAISAADTVFVGDSEADLGAARAAGLGFYGIAATETARNRLVATGATDIFSSPATLLVHLDLRLRSPAPDTEAK
jgi:phosphoglycolate phosphatase-like HAD superfamily hydrolase